ncbi:MULTISPECIES: TraR/DksA C4-type zinc finger protein [unclassified Streptomyces]|uniref:TraR/DksA family transcriptional regulator n=1 Tax=unclassified Streptomyces TaxID=2593676 RepID=UPI00381DBB4B
MVAKKTAAKKTSAAGSTGPAGGAEDVAGAPPPAGEPAADPGAADVTETPAAKKGAARKAVAGKSAAKRTAAKRTTAGKAVAGRTAAAKEAEVADAGDTGAAGEKPPGRTRAKRTAAGKAPAAERRTGARTVAAKKTAGGVTADGDGAVVPTARTGGLAVRPGEEPWTPAEVTEARTTLQSEVLRLRSELAHSREELTGLMRNSGDGAGDDQADTGTKNITREHELALAANAREMLEQTEHALERLDAGTYGLCEVCGKPIGKARMQAFPRATLCVEDKQRQERRG